MAILQQVVAHNFFQGICLILLGLLTVMGAVHFKSTDLNDSGKALIGAGLVWLKPTAG